MGTSAEVLAQWFDHGVADGATHMIVVCDTYDWDDYPVYVTPTEDAREKAQTYNDKEMQQVMEVYDLALPKADQMAEFRAFNYGNQPTDPLPSNEAPMSDTPSQDHTYPKRKAAASIPIPNSAGGDVDFTPDAVRGYLDLAIRQWRNTRDTSPDDVEQTMATHYIDAFQSVRMSLFGDLLQADEEDPGDEPVTYTI